MLHSPTTGKLLRGAVLFYTHGYFSIAGATPRSALPSAVRQANSLATFKSAFQREIMGRWLYGSFSQQGIGGKAKVAAYVERVVNTKHAMQTVFIEQNSANMVMRKSVIGAVFQREIMSQWLYKSFSQQGIGGKAKVAAYVERVVNTKHAMQTVFIEQNSANMVMRESVIGAVFQWEIMGQLSALAAYVERVVNTRCKRCLLNKTQQN